MPPTLTEQKKPKLFYRKKWTLLVVAAIRAAYLGFSLVLISLLYEYHPGDYMALFTITVFVVSVSFEVFGLIGAALEHVCSIMFYLGYCITAWVLNLFANIFFADLLTEADGRALVFQVILTFLYIVLVCYYLHDCKTVQKSKQQQQQTNDRQLNVSYRPPGVVIQVV